MSILLTLANIVSVIGSFAGMIFIAHKKRIGFVIFFFVECSMSYIGYMTEQYGIILMSVLYFTANMYSFYCWSTGD